MYTNLKSQRLSLRPINTEDAAFILELVNSEGWLKNIGDRNIKNDTDATNYILRILANTNFFYHVIEHLETNEKLGILTFLQREDYSNPDIGFALLPQFEKNGYVFEASQIYLEEISKLNVYQEILGITIPANFASIKVLEKLGFQFDKKIEKNEEKLNVYSLQFPII